MSWNCLANGLAGLAMRWSGKVMCLSGLAMGWSGLAMAWLGRAICGVRWACHGLAMGRP